MPYTIDDFRQAVSITDLIHRSNELYSDEKLTTQGTQAGVTCLPIDHNWAVVLNIIPHADTENAETQFWTNLEEPDATP